MQTSPYIKGLNRQAKFLGLQLPLIAVAVLPGYSLFIFLDSLWFFTLVPVSWLGLWIASLINPHFAQFLVVLFFKTPEAILNQSTGIRYE